MARIFDLPLLDSLVPLVAAGSPTPTFSRASVATVMGYDASDNLRLLTVGSGEARFMGARRIGAGNWSRFFSGGQLITPANGGDASVCDDGGPFGFLNESATTNVCLWSEDITNAAWVKTGFTPTANTDLAPDGTTTMDTLTATAPNATCLQTLVSGSASKDYSVWIKRKVGSGNVQITMDNVSWTTVPVTATPLRFHVGQTLANEVIGVRCVTSGDAIAVWGHQDNVADAIGVLFKSYVPTTSASASSVADALSYDTANFSSVAGTAYAEHVPNVAALSSYGQFRILGAAAVVLGGGVDAASRVYGFIYDGGPPQDVGGSLATGVRRFTSTWTLGGTMRPYLDGATNTPVSNANPLFGGGANIGNGGGSNISGPIRNVRIWDTVMPIAANGEVIDAGGYTFTRRRRRM